MFLYYDGYLVDSNGSVMRAVRSSLKEHRIIESTILFAFHKVPDELNERFQSFIEAFRARTALTCVGLACRTARQLLPELEIPQTHNPMRVIRRLIELKSQDADNVEVVVLGERGLEYLILETQERVFETTSETAMQAGMLGIIVLLPLALFLLN